MPCGQCYMFAICVLLGQDSISFFSGNICVSFLVERIIIITTETAAINCFTSQPVKWQEMDVDNI